MVSAAVAAWRRSRTGALGSAWRFAVAAIVPGWSSCQLRRRLATSTAAVVMPGFALLGGLWVEEAVSARRRLDGTMTKATSVLLGAVAIFCRPRCSSGCCTWERGACGARGDLAGGLGVGTCLAVRSWLAARGGRLGSALAGAVACWVVAWSCWAPLVFPLIDRAQDLGPVVEGGGEYRGRPPPWALAARRDHRRRDGLRGRPDRRAESPVSRSSASAWPPRRTFALLRKRRAPSRRRPASHYCWAGWGSRWCGASTCRRRRPQLRDPGATGLSLSEDSVREIARVARHFSDRLLAQKPSRLRQGRVRSLNVCRSERRASLVS